MTLSLGVAPILGLLALVATLQVATFAAVLNNARASTSAKEQAADAKEEATDAQTDAADALDLAEAVERDVARVDRRLDLVTDGGEEEG